MISSILASIMPVSEIRNFPAEQGIYAYFSDPTVDLKEFGKDGGALYVGLAEKSLHERYTLCHLAAGKTGSSSFRRSLGAILKGKLNLTAIKRDKNSLKLRADKYKFTDEGESRLTAWMMDNLKIGFWENNSPLSKKDLRVLEEKVILELKPKLDLDKRTRINNQFAGLLDGYRKICRQEVRENLINHP